jgi:hypothetical protein
MRACANEQRTELEQRLRRQGVEEEFSSPEFRSNIIFEAPALFEIVQSGDTPDLARQAGNELPTRLTRSSLVVRAKADELSTVATRRQHCIGQSLLAKVSTAGGSPVYVFTWCISPREHE